MHLDSIYVVRRKLPNQVEKRFILQPQAGASYSQPLLTTSIRNQRTSLSNPYHCNLAAVQNFHNSTLEVTVLSTSKAETFHGSSTFREFSVSRLVETAEALNDVERM